MQPLKYYIPSIAPGSLVVYNHDQLPDFKGKFISSALALRHLNLVSVNSPNLCEDRPLLTFNYRIRALTIGLDNNLYFSVDNVGIFRVEKVLQDEV